MAHTDVSFLHRYLNTCKLVNLRAQEQADRVGLVEKEHFWPQSFPDCTPALRKLTYRFHVVPILFGTATNETLLGVLNIGEAMNHWLNTEFVRSKRARCLVLIGPTGTGKTSFAKSLPGRFNYFQQSWNVDNWNDYARYSIYDDIPWDDFEKRFFPSKMSLLTQNGPMQVREEQVFSSHSLVISVLKNIFRWAFLVNFSYCLQATSKYRPMRNIDVNQPAIVLLNKQLAGSLLAQPRNEEEQDWADYWGERAYVYVMGKQGHWNIVSLLN